MERTRTGISVVVLVAAIGGVLTMINGRPAATAAPATAAAQASLSSTSDAPAKAQDAKTARPAPHSASALINEYLCGYDLPACAAFGDAENGKYSIDTMVAIVPDPVESGLGSDFDDSIESIQRAASAMKYLPDRFDLPWTPPAPGESAASAPVKTGLGDAEPEVGGVSRNPESEPGLIMFRDQTGTSLLVVFLIGETPTAGIHKAAFVRTVRQICGLRSEFPSTADGHGLKPGPIKVLGPTYSGSAQSLKLAIEDARRDSEECGLDKINIISGSASAVDTADFNQDGISFEATTLSGDEEIPALLKAFSARPGEFVVLNEEGTAYGTDWRWHQEKEEEDSRRKKKWPGITYLAFPIHIAELENAAAQQQAALQAAGANIPALGRQNLPLTSPAQSRRDVVPLYSSSTTPVLELILENLLMTVKQRQIRYVLIEATDVQDTIYLAGQVRAANSNVRVIALNSNLLYLHSEFNPALRGMLVASPYPLFIEDQVWNRRADVLLHPIQFSSDQSEGAYNAAVALLGGPEQMLDYGEASDSRKLPLWVSVVGRNGLWPVAQVDVPDTRNYTLMRPTAEGATALEAPRVTMFTAGAFMILAIAGLLAALLARMAHRRPAYLPAGVAQYLGDSVFPEYRGERRIYQLEAAAIALVLLVTFAIYLLATGGWPGTFPATSSGNDAVAHQLRIYRATHLGSGVSPLAPVLLASFAALTLLFGSIRRRVLMETHQLLTPYLAFGTDSFEGVAALEAEVREASEGNLVRSWRWWLVVIVTVALYVGVVRSWQYSPLDGALLKAMYLVTSTVAYVCVASAILRMVTLWIATRRLLHRMYWHPSRDGYATVRDQMPGDKVSSIDLLSSVATMVPLEAGLSYARAINDLACGEQPASALARRLRESRGRLRDAIAQAELRVKQTLDAGARGYWRLEIQNRRNAEQDAAAVSGCVAYIVEPAWRKIDTDLVTELIWDKEELAVNLGAAYVATRVVDFLRAVMPHLRMLAIASTVAVLLLLLAASSYPFPVSDDLLWFGWALVILAAGSTTWMYVSMNRDRVISLISGTTPGAVNWSSTFLLQILTHAIVPVMVLLGVAFPEQLSRLVNWAGGLFSVHG